MVAYTNINKNRFKGNGKKEKYKENWRENTLINAYVFIQWRISLLIDNTCK